MSCPALVLLESNQAQDPQMFCCWRKMRWAARGTLKHWRKGNKLRPCMANLGLDLSLQQKIQSYASHLRALWPKHTSVPERSRRCCRPRVVPRKSPDSASLSPSHTRPPPTAKQSLTIPLKIIQPEIPSQLAEQPTWCFSGTRLPTKDALLTTSTSVAVQPKSIA